MNVTRLMWTRLMCSRDRHELESLKSKLCKAGIPSEVRYNPVAAERGSSPLEIVVDERDLFRASKVCQGLETAASADDAAGSPGGGRIINGFGKSEESELVTEAEAIPSPSTESPREENPSRRSETGGVRPGGEFAQATALLEKKTEELLNEMQALEVRLKASGQTLAASQARLESQTRELSDQQARISALAQDVSSRDAQLEGMAASLTKARAGMEQEKDLRLAAEQKSGDLAAALRSFECQLAEQARQREQLLDERRAEQEQMRVCVGKVNDLCGRVSSVLAARDH